jgi:uncharacterized RDD family membrane protein YckC
MDERADAQLGGDPAGGRGLLPGTAGHKDSLVLALIPPLAVAIAVASKLYVLSELVVLWFNRRRRAIHDFIAGTVVIHDPRLPLLPWKKTRGPITTSK